MLSQVTASTVRKAQRAADAASNKLDALVREARDHFSETKDVVGLRLLTLLLAQRAHTMALANYMLTQALFQAQETTKVQRRVRSLGKKLR